MAERVEIVAYDDTWPDAFRAIVAQLTTLLGNGVVSIDHIGSTSVPGLSAKPMIDIDVTVRDAAAVAQGCAIMTAAGYEPRGNRYDSQVFAFMDRKATPKQRIYLCPEGSDTHRRRILFRDYLRANPDKARAYEAPKRRLAAEFTDDGDAYTAAKAGFVDDVVDLACATTAAVSAG
ncbi:GrpB family protein [Rhizobium sp. S152]|uniref:GrpB family protein n=1 Tax=Rhizobium sp. S152 TaxID=3055038 RepID=UPI0025A99C78|nr:GrpB family protein [Rhizobium sp. S152]MDM9629623.1 GrpB family protein [Rhizobium sp. S152]